MRAGELRRHLRMQFVGRALPGDVGERLGPSERGAFARAARACNEATAVAKASSPIPRCVAAVLASAARLVASSTSRNCIALALRANRCASVA